MKARELHRHIHAMNTKINDIIGKETRGVHFGGEKELFTAIASIEDFYDLSYAKDAQLLRPQIMNIMINAMLEEQEIEHIILKLENKGLTKENASKVARTENQRIKNLASWYQYYSAGYKFFSVECGENPDETCQEAYKESEKHPIEEWNMLPPFQGECSCKLVFHRK